jgi:hypothetical protein
MNPVVEYVYIIFMFYFLKLNLKEELLFLLSLLDPYILNPAFNILQIQLQQSIFFHISFVP